MPGLSVVTITPDGRPPFRADHVGSFLRPPELLAARDYARLRVGDAPGNALRVVVDVERHDDEPEAEHMLLFVVGGNQPQNEFTPSSMDRVEEFGRQAGLGDDLVFRLSVTLDEAVTNVVRHAKASEARIRLHLEPDAFTLEIADNGRGVAGLDPQAAQTRNGLRNMRKRMEDVGGSFAIGPGPEGGAIVRLRTPLGKGVSPTY